MGALVLYGLLFPLGMLVQNGLHFLSGVLEGQRVSGGVGYAFSVGFYGGVAHDGFLVMLDALQLKGFLPFHGTLLSIGLQ